MALEQSVMDARKWVRQSPGGKTATQVHVFCQDVMLVYQQISGKPRVEAYTDLKAQCKKMPFDKTMARVQAICDSLGYRPRSEHPLFRFLDWDDARQMAESSLVDIGAHTVDHASLARLPNAEMRDQIDRSVETVSQEIGGQCNLFSYPEGQPDDYDDRVIAHLRDHGINHAPSAIDGHNDLEKTDPFHIKRIMVGFEGWRYPFAPL